MCVKIIITSNWHYLSILAVVIEVKQLLLFRNETWYVNQLYTRNQCTVSKKKLSSLNEVLFDQAISLRQVSTKCSNSGYQGFVGYNFLKKIPYKQM